MPKRDGNLIVQSFPASRWEPEVSDPRFFELTQLPLKQRAARIAELFAEGVENDCPAPSRAKRRKAREETLAERPAAALSRKLRGTFHWLAPKNLPAAILAFARMTHDWMTAHQMPSPARAARAPEGFCGRAASLAPEYLIDAYARGLTLRNFMGTPTLWAPTSRSVLRPWDFPRGIGAIRAEGERVSLDEAFDAVLAACRSAEPAHWRKPALDMALGDLYDAGFAHSLEVRDRNGVLIAGLIGVAAGGVFTIERMFALDEDALAHAANNLAFQLQRWNFALIDIRSPSNLATRLQCATMTRANFCGELASNACGGRHGRWRIAEDLRPLVRRIGDSSLKIVASA
jgi:leucyl/phenylalanyl-tRNA--protein transferase